MPVPASALEKENYLRVLLMGVAKIGKSTSSVVSLANAFGLGYVIECSKADSLLPAQRRTTKFEYDLVKDEVSMDAAIKTARAGVKEGKYGWVVLDDFTLYSDFLENALADQANNDGRRYWPEYHKRLNSALSRLLDCKCHIVCVCHYLEQSPEIEGQLHKSGKGYVPNLGGKSRATVPAMFRDVIFMEKNKAGERVFKINPEGVWGIGGRSIDGTREIPADFGLFLAEAAKEK